LTVALAAPGLIDRGDLVAALDRAVTRKVTIISAPAGSGKTSLLRAWAVNAHIRSIYAKLGVRDRSSAVRRARELRLLAAGRPDALAQR